MRCMHEAQLHPDNSFLTLTYSEDNLPERGSLKYTDFQRFLKRYRKHTGANRLRFYMCGEYGSQTNRPHYHAAIFGHDFHDKRHWRTTEAGHRCYRSEQLEKLWPYGQSEIGELTFESAAYIARYCTEKVTGIMSKFAYEGREPPFNQMSRKPGIGAGWLDKYQTDVYPHDYVITNGKETKPPKYYDTKIKTLDPDMYDLVKRTRETEAAKRADDNTPARLLVKEQVKKAQIRQLNRTEL